jgi:hypothetical protein
MGISSIFLVLAVLVLVGLYLYAPFTTGERGTRAGESHEVSALKAERDRVINSLQELDFDHSLGKIPAEDYPEQRAALLQKGADILRELDQIASLTPTPILGASPLPFRADVASWERDQGRGRTAEFRIEKAAAAGRADSSAKISQFADEEIESMIAARRKEHKGKSAGFCPKCGNPVLVSDRFCPSCGKSLA